MAIIKNKYKDKIDKQIKTFPNGTIPLDFTKKITYDNETLVNPSIIRTPRYGDDLDSNEFSKVIADLVYNDTIINEEMEKHNYLYSNGVIKNYKKEFEAYDKKLFQILASYEISTFVDKNTFSLKPPNSIASNFSNNVFCNFYFYTNSERLLNEYDFFYKEYLIEDIQSETNNTGNNFADDYSIIIFNTEINNEDLVIQTGEMIGVVLYLPTDVRNVTPYKSKNYINYIKIGNGALKIGDTFLDIKKDTFVSRSIIDDENLTQIKVPDIISTKFKESFRTRRDILVAYYDQTTVMNNMVFDGIVDLIIGDERINIYSPLDSQLLTTPRIKKIEYLTINNESFHRIYLDDLCLLKGVNSNGDEILFRKNNQLFTIRNSVNNIFDGEFLIKNINYTERTIDFVHPLYDSSYFQPIDTDNVVGYFGHIVPNIYVLYSLLVQKDNGFNSETQIMQADEIYGYVGLESGITRIEKTALEINSNGMFEVSKNVIKHLKNFNGNLLEYDDGQSVDVPSVTATGFTLQSSNGDYILRPTEQQLPNEYDEIGLNSLSNSHFIITENKFNVINNSKIILSEIYLGIKNSLASIGTEGIKIKLEKIEMLYSLDNPRRIDNIQINNQNTDEFIITLSTPDVNIQVDDILFIMYNSYQVGGQIFNGNGDYQTVKIKRIENQKIIIDKLNSTYSAEFKYNNRYPIFFNIIKKNSITKICESLLTNNEIRNQIINGLNGKFGPRNGFSKLKFDKFIENIVPNNDLLENGIQISDAKNFALDTNTYYYISVSGFVINNIASVYSSILIEDFNAGDDLHFKKSIYYEINIKSFKGRYPNSLIISDEFGDINVFDITRTFSPFFRAPKYSIMAHDFSNLSISKNDIPISEDVVFFDPLSGRFKFHPNVTPTRIYLSYYVTENLSGASEAENFIYKRGEDSNDTVRGKIQELDNKYIYGANFDSPISIDGITVNNNLNYKGPFVIKNNKITLKTNANFVNLNSEKYEIEIDKNSSYEIIDLEKKSLYLKNNLVEKNNTLQSINRQFLDQLSDQTEKDYYEKPILNKSEELIINISEDTTIDKSLLNTKKWQNALKDENEITIPFLSNKKFNKINFYNFSKDLIIECLERTKIENLTINETNLNDLLKEFVYRKLNEKNYKYALQDNYLENKDFSFNQSNEIRQLNKTIIKDSKDFGKSEMVSVFTESENNALISRKTFDYDNINLNKNNSDNFIIINEHIVNFSLKKINKKYANEISFSDESLNYNSILPTVGLTEGKLYFFKNVGYNTFFEKNIEIGDFIIRNDQNAWDFYKKEDFFNISHLVKTDDFSYILNDFNFLNIEYKISNFDNSLQKLLINNILLREEIVKINEESFFISLLIKDTNDTHNLYLQFFEVDENGFFSPKLFSGLEYLKIATSQLSSTLVRIDKNNLFYNYLTLDNNKILFTIMSLDGFIFKYFYINDLTFDDDVVFINDKKTKNNPKLLKLNDEIFAIVFNSENNLNYDTSIGDLEIKIYNIENKKNIIFSYNEKSSNYEEVDKILLDNIKNNSYFNTLKITDDSFAVFYSNSNAFYLNTLGQNIEEEYIFDARIGLLNCFKLIKYIKTETSYIFDTSNKKTVFYQNINETVFPPKIYPFKINSNLFGVNYVQYDLNNNEIGNRMFSFDSEGVKQKIYFENEYTEESTDKIKYIYGLNNRQALEFSENGIKIHNFNNDYSQLILKDSVDYKKYFLKYNNNGELISDYYENIFENKIANPIEIKTIKDKNGNVFNRKIISFFTRENSDIILNLLSSDKFDIDFDDINKSIINDQNGLLVEEDDYIFYQNEILYIEDKIFLLYIFLLYDPTLSNQNRLKTTIFDITDVLNNGLAFPSPFGSNIETIKNIKISSTNNKNKFFFNKIDNAKIEIYCLRNFDINLVNKDLISRYTFELLDENGQYIYSETRNLQDYSLDQNIDLILPNNVNAIFKINLNNKIKYIAEKEEIINGINNYSYFYLQNDLQIFNLFTLTIDNFNVNYCHYNDENDEITLLGNTLNNIKSYVFNFNTNLFQDKVLETIDDNKYNFFKIDDTDKECYFYYKIVDNELHVKIFNKQINKNLLLVYNNIYTYEENISDISFNDYLNVYDTFVYFPNSLIKEIWQFFPMNSIINNKNLLDFDVFENKLEINTKSKNVFSGLCVSGILNYDSVSNKNSVFFFEESFMTKINNLNSLQGLIFYINSSGSICVFRVLEKMNESDSYEIIYLVEGTNDEALLNRKLDFMQYKNEEYSFYKKSYQSLSLKINMFNYKGLKKNEYELYRKNNYFYNFSDNYENNNIYKSNVFIIPGNYKDFKVIYHITDENEKTSIYSKKYLIINNSLYSFEKKEKISIDNYDSNDKLFFICETLDNSNIFISFKKNNEFVRNLIFNKNYGLEELDPDISKKELYKFITIKDGTVENVLNNSSYEIIPYAAKKLFNNYLLFLLKIKKGNTVKIAHIIYKENGANIDYYQNDFNKIYELPQSEDILGYSQPIINSYGYTSLFIYKKDSSRDILQFGIDGEGGVCKLKGINNLF